LVLPFIIEENQLPTAPLLSVKSYAEYPTTISVICICQFAYNSASAPPASGANLGLSSVPIKALLCLSDAAIIRCKQYRKEIEGKIDCMNHPHQRRLGRVGLLLVALFLISACGSRNAPTATVTVLPTAGATDTAVPAATPTPQTIVVQRAAQPTVGAGLLAARATPVDPATTLPLWAAHLAAVQAALQQSIPVLTLTELDGTQALAQALALQDERFLANLRDTTTGAALRSEIFGVYPVRPSDVTEDTMACAEHRCYRVEMYNYALNLSTIAIVDVDAKSTLAVNDVPQTQPDIPAHLIQVAQEIAANAPEVAEALGVQPTMVDATMASSKTALNASRCERSHHLCVAPTFMHGDRALWAIVDLTDGTVVGVRWTELGAVGGEVTAPTEKELQDEVVKREFCDKTNTLSRDGWALDYVLTSSDGLLVSNVTFNGAAILESAKLVDWHVSYSISEGFGYSDAIGCPIFSQAAVVAFNGPVIETILDNEKAVGFALNQEFRNEFWPAPCNYFYSQRFEFYLDGRFRIAFANHGRGCGNSGTYRPVARIVPAGVLNFAQWDGAAWQPWQQEQWAAPFDATTAEGYQFRLTAADGVGYYIEPGRGQFADGGRGDNPYIYVTRHHTAGAGPDEGDSDLITIGPCCNTDYQQGPEKFVNDESIAESPLVFWYVAQMQNDDTPGQEYCWADLVLRDGVYTTVDYPCYAGPLFVPHRVDTQ
jgi:hypothetical protein